MPNTGPGGMRPEDVYDLVTVADPRLSPDGTTVAFVLQTIDAEASEYRTSVWVVPADGSAPARRFTHGPRNDAAPRWSPDGTRLAFVSNRDDEKAPQLYLIPADGGEAQKLTELKEAVEAPVWSPDGTQIAFLSRVRDDAYEEEDEKKRRPRRFTRLQHKLDNVGWTGDRRKHVFVVAADGSSDATQITAGDFEHGVPCWSPDSGRLAFAAARHPDWDVDTASDVYVVAAGGGEPQLVTMTDGSCAWPSWSPDGERIAYLYTPGVFDSPRHTQVAVVDPSTGERCVLTAPLDRNCAPFMATREPLWLTHGDADVLLFAFEDAGRNLLGTVPADGSGPLRAPGDVDFRIHGYDVVGTVGVHVGSTPTSLPELYRDEQRLTDFGDDFAGAHELAAPERFTATSKDGSEVEAWIMRPVGADAGARYPVLVNIHGGPFTQYGNGFFDEFQIYAGAGYAVVYANPRGSSGYSEAWGRAINGPKRGGSGWGTVDFEDVMAVTETAVERFPFCDPDRVGVMGGSYGGYLTSWIVAHSGRFRAGCSERAVNAWHSMHGSSDIGWVFKGDTGSFVFEDPDEWTRMSPITYAQDIHTPLLILHSENDLRCPIEQAEQLFTTLRLLKRDVEFVRFPGEGHELSRSGSPAHRVQRFWTILDWFERKLK